jgi:hypothetical protein
MSALAAVEDATRSVDSPESSGPKASSDLDPAPPITAEALPLALERDEAKSDNGIDLDAGESTRSSEVAEEPKSDIVQDEDVNPVEDEVLTGLSLEEDLPVIEAYDPDPIHSAMSTAEALPPTLLPMPAEDSWRPWIRFGLTTAVVATGVYYTGGLAVSRTVAQRVALAYSLSYADSLRKHIQFLHPIWGERKTDIQAKLRELIGLVHFRCFYVDVSA